MGADAASGAAVDIEEHVLAYTRPYLYPKQNAAIFDLRRYSCIEASTKAGKTTGCIAWLFEQAMAGKAGQNFWWVAPVSGQAAIAFRRMRQAVPQHLYVANLTDKTMSFINGCVVWFKSADKPDSLYGEDVYAGVIDEASRVKEDAWHAIRSTLTATRGPLRIIGNVKGRRNWFYKLAERARKGDDPNYGYHKITAYDAVEAGVLAADEISDAQTALPKHVFDELYLAIPADDGGNPFGLAAIEACVENIPRTTAPKVWGWDLAKKQDYTVGIALDDLGRVCRFVRLPHGQGWEDIIESILRHTGATPALVDSTGVGDPILDRLQKKRANTFEGYVFSQASKQRLMEGLAVAIGKSEIRIPPGPTSSSITVGDPAHIKDELDIFEFEYSRTGVRYAAPPGYHDDCVMALALAVQHKAQARMPVKVSKKAVAKARLHRFAPRAGRLG